MSFGGPANPYQPPPWPPNGGPYPPPPATGPHIPPQPGPAPYGYPPPQLYPPQPYPPQPPPGPYPYGPPPRPSTSLWGMLRDLRGAEWPPLRVLLRGGRARIHGCSWALLLFPCTWTLVLPLMACYVFARSARSRAHRLFPPRGHRPIEEPLVTRVQKARAWTAAAMSVLLLAVYGKPEDISEAQELYMMRLVVTPVLLLLSAPVIIALLFRWASPRTRAEMRPRMRAALRSSLWYIGAVTAVPLFAVAITLLEQNSTTSSGTSGPTPWFAVAVVLPFLWVLFFLGFATGPAVRTAFNTAAVHAALPALLTGVLVWEFWVISLLAGGLPPGPPVIQLLAVIGGPVSVTAVVWWEIHRLRTLYGVRLRA